MSLLAYSPYSNSARFSIHSLDSHIPRPFIAVVTWSLLPGRDVGDLPKEEPIDYFLSSPGYRLLKPSFLPPRPDLQFGMECLAKKLVTQLITQ
ncbi:hypothetical protein E2C01_102103 [Portunus trituberculatus]|uniref:Uncharacterized protein n=1 Tax=Portunus trituberculatus TaxID=210409 RepID=A0A5B7KLT0_PORTR|nr:hypothetical protein [Portunus trituberculatus]